MLKLLPIDINLASFCNVFMKLEKPSLSSTIDLCKSCDNIRIAYTGYYKRYFSYLIHSFIIILVCLIYHLNSPILSFFYKQTLNKTNIITTKREA